LGAAEKFNMVQHLEGLEKKEKAIVKRGNIKDVNEFVPGFSEGDRTRSFVKVQDGCDYFCSFCTIPLARGKSRSRTVAQTVDMLKEVGETGIKEVVLTGVNLGDFGINHGETFYDLITELEKIKEIPRYRISSIEPNLLENRIIDFVAKSGKFMPHFHIPLQSGSDKILESMRRKYRRELYEDRVNRIKSLMAHCAIGVDVIVGYPGETEDDFLETYRFLNELDISYLHVFPYSERPNTTAKKIKEVVPYKIRSERTEMLRILSEKKKHHFYSQHLNRTFDVLFEKEEKQDKMYGFTPNYIKVETDYDPLFVNEIVPFRIEGINSESGCVSGVTEVLIA
jgi:threonylcarbamoyladenosine tRNA methylthiotransferase MtaB